MSYSKSYFNIFILDCHSLVKKVPDRQAALEQLEIREVPLPWASYLYMSDNLSRSSVEPNRSLLWIHYKSVAVKFPGTAERQFSLSLALPLL